MSDNATQIQLEAGSYEIIKSRLQDSKSTLRGKLDLLNTDRKNVFGGVETELKSTIRIHTDNNCVAQDIIALGDQCIFGFNVHIGLRAVTRVADVFATYSFDDGTFTVNQGEIIGDSQFSQDLENLYKYYRNSTFYRFWRKDAYLYMIFKVSEQDGDYKAFKWIVDGQSLRYIDNRSEHEYVKSNQYSFVWKRASRDDFRNGTHPHVSILDRVFVETVGGDLTIKIEDNTDDGQGIYNEPVDSRDQQLDDAQIEFADLGSLIILKIKPYLEDERYFIYNDKLKEVVKIDSIGDSCQILPEDHGIMVSNGYYLKTGDQKIFDLDTIAMRYESRAPSVNGEDHLFTYFDPKDGRYVLLSYNIISQQVEVPMLCNGYCIFEDGTLAHFRRETDPGKHHTIQLWTTPYSADIIPQDEHADSLLYKIGNKEIVSFMSECASLISLIDKENPYSDLYHDMSNQCISIKDSYYWIDKPEAHEFTATIDTIKVSAETAISEYQKVLNIRKSTNEAIRTIEQESKTLFKSIDTLSLDSIVTFVKTITDLRTLRGNILTTKEMRYADTDLLEDLDEQAGEKSLQLEKECVNYLLHPKALEEYKKRIKEVDGKVEKIKTSVVANELTKDCESIGKDLELLIDIVGSLQINDPTETTKIIERVSQSYSKLNGIKARIRQQFTSIRKTESQAEFEAQLRLLDQSVINAIDIAETPDSCTAALNRIMLIIEEIEGKFIDQEDYIALIHQKREEIHNAFETKRLQLVEKKNRRALSLSESAQRLIAGISNRVKKLDEEAAINAFYASDVMVQKVRSVVKDLYELGDTVKADDLSSALKSSKEEMLRGLRDRQDLYVDGDNILQLGKHQFSINNQALELTIVPVNDRLNLHIAGSNFFLPVDDELLNGHPDFWDQIYPSEDRELYRGEYLWYQYAQGKTFDIIPNEDKLKNEITAFASTKLNEGYEKGIHDHDATLIGRALLHKREDVGLLTYASTDRAWASLFWSYMLSKSEKDRWKEQLKNAKNILKSFPKSDIKTSLAQTMLTAMSTVELPDILSDADVPKAATFLIDSLLVGDQFVFSEASFKLCADFASHLKMLKANGNYDKGLASAGEDVSVVLSYVKNWVDSYLNEHAPDTDADIWIEVITQLLLKDATQEVIGSSWIQVDGLLGDHQVVQNGTYKIKYHQFYAKAERYTAETLPQFVAYHERKHELLESWRQKLRLEELRPQVLSSFIRNQLLDEVYLPIIGDNLAKQIGSVGENGRTDRMGLLLLVSPPGYGKTTLMEYIADRLGLTFIKVNGPAIGHDVTSLDPNQANNSAAMQELDKLNLSFEIGDNIMIYLDDIQHCHPEFLQKFISLCDGQRKIEGSYNGVSKTYDFRGKKVAVVMAGNPYTETGAKFQIPDMLANRADVYNLGDMLTGTDDAFKTSYIENALSSNSYLQRLANKSLKDVHALLKHIDNGASSNLELEASHTPEEIQEYLSILKKLLTIRDVILKVNQSYIDSAAKSDLYRVEPAFKLQGSYRNMSKLAEKIVPIMNDHEVQSLIMDHYQGEVQTLTKDSEANLLLFKRLIDRLDETEAERLDYIIQVYQEQKAQNSGDMIQPVLQELRNFNEILKGIREDLGK